MLPSTIKANHAAAMGPLERRWVSIIIGSDNLFKDVVSSGAATVANMELAWRFYDLLLKVVRCVVVASKTYRETCQMFRFTQIMGSMK